MRQLSCRAAQCSTAPHRQLPPSYSSLHLPALGSSPVYNARRSYGATPPLLSSDPAALHGTPKSTKASSKAGVGSLFHKTSPAASASTTASSANCHKERAEAIRRNEELLRWLRRLVVPAFSLLGLFVLRPTEGHFLRYTAERRHLDTDFNAWFPPVSAAPAAPAKGSSGEKQRGEDAQETVSASWFSRFFKSTTESHSNTAEGDAGSAADAGGAASSSPSAKAQKKVDVTTAFRSPQDRDWAAQKFHYKKGSEDEERVARRRLLFARERSYLVDDTVVETIRSPEAQMAELQALREHPPMHLLSEQLNSMVRESKAYLAATTTRNTESGDSLSDSEKTSLPPPPQVLIEFEDHRLFATAAIVFRDKSGNVGRTMRFVGACGMLWKQVS